MFIWTMITETHSPSMSERPPNERLARLPPAPEPPRPPARVEAAQAA
jgi:hypothetical protein